MATVSKVGVTNFTMASETEIVITRVFDAPRRLIFEAYTKCEHLQKWLLGGDGWTMPVCEIDLRPGGACRFVWRRPNGKEMEIRGVYREVVPPERLVATESWGGDWPDTLNTIVLIEENGQTTFTLTMEYPSREARDAAYETGVKAGTTQSYDRLEEYLRTMG